MPVAGCTVSRSHGAANVVAAFVAGCIAAALLGAPSPATAARKSDEARALERIARVLEGKCKP
jgi:hypothetical protein